MIRIAGMQVLISVATGTSGGNYTSSLAGLAAILKSSRDAEREADAYAVGMLSAARVDPMALKHFFEKILKEEGKSAGSAFSNLGTVFSTHPVTTERMERIKFGGSLEIGRETLTRDAVLMAWTITRAVLSPPDITNVLLSGMEEGRIAETEMIDLHNAILDFTAERVLARVTPTGRA